MQLVDMVMNFIVVTKSAHIHTSTSFSDDTSDQFLFLCSGIEIELEMHPVELLTRSKRSKRSDVAAQMLINDYNDEMSSLYWQSRAQHTLRDQLKKEQNHNVAKNIIFFLGKI